MRQTAFFFLLLFIQTGVSAQATDYRKQQNYKEWVHLAPKFNDAFFRTEEAQRIGDNVLLYQQVTGGWPKNIYMPAELTEQEYTKAWNAKGDVNQSTIDNNATTTEIQYLARLYQATQKEKYKEGVLKGIQYLLKAQYDNGGWPQFYPRPTGYYVQITYNDNAMVRVMQQLREIYEKQSPYSFIPDETCQQARKAFDKGIECILRTQVRQNGDLTVWCAQHDRITLEPCKARAYELPSLSGQESDNIVLLLMSLPHPSEKVIESIESAVKWFKKSEIKGIQKEYFTNSDGKRDYRMIPCEDCPILWARFYELDTNRPFFSDRDYYVNSFHVDVREPVSIVEKIRLEAPFHAITRGGHITYVELDGEARKNPVAILKIVKVMQDEGIGYGSINHPIDTCRKCGHRGVIYSKCPVCGSDDILRMRRITGYLTGSLESWNSAKQAEERDRVKHR